MAKKMKKAASKKMTLEGAKKLAAEAQSVRERSEYAINVLNNERDKLADRMDEIDNLVEELYSI